MKKIRLLTVLILAFFHGLSFAFDGLSTKPKPPLIDPSDGVQILNNGQIVNFTVEPYESKLFKIWIPENAAHLKINYLHQTPFMFFYSNAGSEPFSGGERPDCERPSYTEELLGIPFNFRQCNFERPESGQYHYIRVTSEYWETTIGLNQLVVRYQPNGLSQVAHDIHVDATYVDSSSNMTITKSSYNNSGNIDYINDSFVDMKFDESLGRFEERPNGACDSGQDANPTYLRLEIFHSEPMESCSFRGSWDSQTVQCSDELLQVLNTTQKSHIINTDDYLMNLNICVPDLNNEHMPAGSVAFPNYHWFEFTAKIRGQSYPRRFSIKKTNGQY